RWHESGAGARPAPRRGRFAVSLPRPAPGAAIGGHRTWPRPCARQNPLSRYGGESKMKSIVALAALAGPVSFSWGCLVAPVEPPVGILFTSYKAPLDYTLEGNPVGSKSGMSSTFSIIGCVALGDASIEAAAQSGGLSKVHSADYEYENIIGLYQ